MTSARILNTALYLFTVACIFLLQSCTTINDLTGSSDELTFDVTSTPPSAIIFVNGEARGKAPLSIPLEAKKKWVGVLVEPGGWKYENNFYYVEAVPDAPDDSRYASDSTYINPRNMDQSRTIHFELPTRAAVSATRLHGTGRILGIKNKSLLPTMKSAGYVWMLQINGQPLAKWNATGYEAVLPEGNYSIAAYCKWDLGIMGEVKIENMWPIKVKIRSNGTYQLRTEQTTNGRCRVSVQTVSE